MDSTETITKFINRVRSASAGRSKEVRLSIEEAHDLSTALVGLLASHISQLQREADAQNQTLTININGGGFK